LVIAVVFAFLVGGVVGVVVAVALGTAARENAVERSYWSGVRASSPVSHLPAVRVVEGGQPPHRAA
jgi:hypothetical protein